MSTLNLQQRLSPRHSQQAFRELLATLAEPGTIAHVDPAMFADGMPPAAVVVLALADVEVAINVDGDRESQLGRTLAHTTDARLTAVEDAGIVTLTVPAPELVRRSPRGSALEPENAARLAIRVDAVHAPAQVGDLALELSGPGVPGTRRIGIGGLPRAVVEEIVSANRAFPAGIDTWLVADDGAITAISRSTQLTVVEEK